MTDYIFSERPHGSLYITAAEFVRGTEVEIPESMIKNLQSLEYLNIAHARYLMKINFDHLEVVVCFNEHGEPVFDLPDDRGSVIGTYITDVRTGAKSAVLWFPVMGRSRKGAIKPAEIDPDARCINDNIARAIVKCIAYYTGIGFNIYARIEEEDLIQSEDHPAVATSTKSDKRRAKAVVREEEDEDDDGYDEEEDEDDEEEDEPVKRRPSATKSASRFPSRGRK